MVISQSHLESIFELELMFNVYRSIMSSPLTSDEYKEYCSNAFYDFKPFIETYLEKMSSFRQLQVEKQ